MGQSIETRRLRVPGKVDAVPAMRSNFIHENAPVAEWDVNDWMAWLSESYKSLDVGDDNFLSYSPQVRRNMAVILEQFYEGMVGFHELIAPKFPQAHARSHGVPTLYIVRKEGMYDDRLQGETTATFTPESRSVHINIEDVLETAAKRDFRVTYNNMILMKNNVHVLSQKSSIVGKFLFDGVEVAAYNFFASGFGVDPADYQKMANASSLVERDSVPLAMFGLLACVAIGTYSLDNEYEKRRGRGNNVDISDDTIQYQLWRIHNAWEQLPKHWQKKLQSFRQDVENKYQASSEHRTDNAKAA